MAVAISLNTSPVPRRAHASRSPAAAPRRTALPSTSTRPWGSSTASSSSSASLGRWRLAPPPAGSRADDSSSPAPFEMSVEGALKVLGVPQGASFDDILRAKNAIIASCKDDQDAISLVEAAYDMLLMQSLTQRRAGKVASSNVRFADVKPVKTTVTDSLPRWMQSTINNLLVSVETPSAGNLGLEAGVYGALMALTYANGAAISIAGVGTGPDVPGLILATGFGVSLYFLTKKNVNLGKAALITVGGLVVGAVIGSAFESWLQVDIIPFLGIRSPAVVVSEFVLFSQFLASLYLR